MLDHLKHTNRIFTSVFPGKLVAWTLGASLRVTQVFSLCEFLQLVSFSPYSQKQTKCKVFPHATASYSCLVHLKVW